MALFVSIGALASLVGLTAWDAMAEPTAQAVEIHAESMVEAPALAGIAAVPSAAPSEEPALALPPEDEPEAEEPTGIEVPDLTEMTSLRALRRGRELGLSVEIRDEDGRRVPPSERLYMRVIEQTPAAGAHVEEGGTVQVEARYPRAGFAAGY